MFGALENSNFEDEKERDFEGELLQLSDENQNLENRASKAEYEVKNLKKALKDLDNEKESELAQLSDEKQNLEIRASKAENEIKNLNKALENLESEKENVRQQYDEILEKVSILERELDRSRMSSRGIDEEACKARDEVEKLKCVLLRLEIERDAAIFKLNECKEKISKLENDLTQAHNDEGGVMGRAVKAEAEAQYLEEELANFKMINIDVCREYDICLEKVSDLEKKLFITQEKAKLLNERADRAENEARALNKALNEACEEKEGIVHRYEHCLEKISKTERELSSAREEVKRLNGAMKLKSEKIKYVEEKCVLLETSNQAMRLEAGTLEKKILIKDEELSKKDDEIERVQSDLQSEHTRFVQAEATLVTLRNLHSQAQREQKALALELKNGLKMLKEMDERKHGLEEEMVQVKDENKSLNKANLSSKIMMENLENEIMVLNEMRERLEKEVGLQTSLTNTLQKEIDGLNDDIQNMNTRYMYLIEQIESVGIDPENIDCSVRDLQDEISRLRAVCIKERDEKAEVVKKLENMKQFIEKNANLESSLSDLSEELQYSHEKVKALQGDKSSLVEEKAVILSQLRAITENMQKLLERNTFLEDSLSGANVELLSLREKSKCLEELCKSLDNDKSNLLNETSTLVLQLSSVENRLENLEKRYAELEDRFVALKNEKEVTLSQVTELRTCLDTEKQKRESFTVSSETRLTKLEDHVQVLREESVLRKKEYEEELDKAVNAQFEIFVLQKFIQDMEQKNSSLLLDCQKHVEASKLSDTVISELENENLEQQVEAEYLLDEIEKLRMGIYQVFRALEIKPDNFNKMENDQFSFHRVVANIEDLKLSIANYEDDKDRLSIENSILVTLFGEMKLEAKEFVLENNILQNKFDTTHENLVVVQNEKSKEMEINKKLNLDLKLRDQRMDVLKAEFERVSKEQREMKIGYQKLHDEYSKKTEENRSLMKTKSDLKGMNKMVEEENHSILLKALELENKSIVLQQFGAEKAEEVKSLYQNLQKMDGLKRGFESDIEELKSELNMKENETLCLKKWSEKLEKELDEVRDINSQLTNELFVRSNQKEVELLILEEKLKAKEMENLKLCKTLEVFKKNNEGAELVIKDFEKQNLDLSEENEIQKYEIENLREFNVSLEFEVGMLREEVEERSIREEYLNSELNEISNEYEMWEAEAESFHFDLQISTVREIFLESKVKELGSVCEELVNDRDLAVVENEHMKRKIGMFECEIGLLKDQLFAYDPVIKLLSDNIASLEHNILPQQEPYVADAHKSEDVEFVTCIPEKSSEQSARKDKFLIPNGASELQQLQNRIKEVEKFVEEEMKRRANLKSPENTKLESAFNEIEDLKANNSIRFEKGKQKGKTQPEFFEMKNGMIMTKDIPLDDISNDSLSGVSRRRFRRVDDQMLELWETSEDDHNRQIKKKAIEPLNLSHRFESVDTSMELQVEKELGVDRLEVPTSGSETTHDRNKRKILERLNSDSQKLKSIQTTVEDLRKKLGENTTKKKKSKNVDFETVKEQLEEVEETIVQLVDFNGKLKKNVEENDKRGSPELEVIGNLRRKRIADHARKGSEKIGRLLVEVQKIQYMLLKIEDEKKNKGKIRFSKSKTSIILNNFISGNRRSSPKRKKPCACGCFRPTNNAEGRNSNEFNRLTY